MKKQLIIFSCILLLLFAAISCKQVDPEIKPDAFASASQGIPAPTTNMDEAQPLTDDQKASFTSDFEKAKEQVFSGLIGYLVTASSEGKAIEPKDVIEYYLNKGVAPTVPTDGPAAPDAGGDSLTVGIDSLSGSLSFKCKSFVLKNSIDGVETEHHFSDVSVNATLSEKTVSIVASGKLEDQDFTFSAKIDVQKIIAGEKPFVEGPTTTPDSLDILKKLEGAILTEAKGIKIAASGININLLFEATGCETKVPVKITVEGSLSISSNSSGHIVVRLDSPLKVKVDANQLGFGSISATVRGLLIEVNPATEYDLVSFSIQEIEISGQILQEMDNIRLKATMKELKINRFDEDSTRLSIKSIEVSALGYQNISAALNIYDFSFIQRPSSATEVLPFDFGVAISFENQKLGLRGLFLSSTPTIEIAVLNDVPVNQESLITFLVELLKGGDSGTV